MPKIGPLLSLQEFVGAYYGFYLSEEEDRLNFLPSRRFCPLSWQPLRFSSDSAFKQLTLAVVDEQHRFGVDQRTALRKKDKA